MNRRTQSYRRERQQPAGRSAHQLRQSRRLKASRQEQKTDKFFAARWEALNWQWECGRYRYGHGLTVKRLGERRHEPCRCGSGRKASKCCKNPPGYELVKLSPKSRPEAAQPAREIHCA